MTITNFTDLVSEVKKMEKKGRIAIVAAHEIHTLEAAKRAKDDNLVTPVLIGNADLIKELLQQLNASDTEFEIIDERDETKCVLKAIELANSGYVQCIMKGKILTANIMRWLVKKESNIRNSKVMSFIGLFEIPNYHKLLAVTDIGLNIYPDLEQKKELIVNGVGLLKKLGVANPKVAVVAALEKVNPKMKETVDADALRQMNVDGEIEGCIVEGPISFDVAVSKESSQIKDFDSQVSGDVDLIVVPDIASGNILSKSLSYFANAHMAGAVVGARIPIILTSRSATVEDKYISMALAAIGTSVD